MEAWNNYKELRVLTTSRGLPAAANVQQAILLAQLEILRRLAAQRAGASAPPPRATD